MFYKSLFVLLYFFFWTLCCLFFFDIRLLISPLVSSNSSWGGDHNAFFMFSIDVIVVECHMTAPTHRYRATSTNVFTACIFHLLFICCLGIECFTVVAECIRVVMLCTCCKIHKSANKGVFACFVVFFCCNYQKNIFRYYKAIVLK